MNKINVHVTKAEKEAPDYYEAWEDKFKPKKTTDDCITPEPVYRAVLDWARREYDIPETTRIIRPFWPGGDYQAEDYSGDCVMIDNPPFSILSQICRWYQERGVRYLLFAPTQTLFSIASGEASYVVCGATVTYANGAKVNTSFVTNLGGWKICVAPELHAAVTAADEEVQSLGKVKIPKYDYPSHVCSAARLQYLASHGVGLKIRKQDASFTRALDAQRQAGGKAIYGAGFLLSGKAAAEKAAAEKADVRIWELSDRERAIIEELSKEDA